MRRLLCAALAAIASTGAASAAEWRTQPLDVPARVTAVETFDGKPHVMAGGLWYRIDLDGGQPKLTFVDTVPVPKLPEGALPDSRVGTGRRDIVRAWLAEPTDRYAHGALGDKTEAGALVIELRGGKRQTLRLKDDAVFEDLRPRLVDLDGDGFDEIVLVKSYVRRGAALAVVGEHNGRYEIVAETPPLGQPNRWLAPAGIADFTGDGKLDIAIVRQPHVVGELQLWSYRSGALNRVATLPAVANHVIGSRAIGMSAAADFDGDGIADLVVPSFDRDRLRIIGFVPDAHEIADAPLPAQAITDLALLSMPSGPPAIVAGLADGRVVLVRRE